MNDKMKRPGSKSGGFSSVEDAARALREENMAIRQDIQNLKRQLEVKKQEEEEQNRTINELRVYNDHLRQRRQENAENRQMIVEAIGSNAHMLGLTKASLDHAQEVRNVAMNQIANCEKWKNTTTDRLTTIHHALEQQVCDTQNELEKSCQNRKAEEEKSVKIQEEMSLLKQSHADAFIQAKAHCSQLAAEETELVSMLQASKVRVSTLTTKKLAKDQELSQLRESVGLINQEVKTWEQTCIKLDEEAGRTESQLELSKQRTAILEKELSEMRHEAGQCETQVDQLQKENDELEAKMAAEELIFKDTINAMKLQKEQLVTQRRGMEENLSAAHEEAAELRRRNLELTSKVAELEKVMESSTTELISKKSEMEDTQRSFLDLTVKLSGLQTKSSEQGVELQFKSQMVKNKEKELDELNAMIIALEASNNEKEKQMESIIAEIERNNKEEEEADVILASLSGELATQEGILVKLESENNVADQNQLDALNLKIETAERLKSEVVDLKGEVTHSEEKKLRILVELRMVDDRILELERDLQALRDDHQGEIDVINADEVALAEKRTAEIRNLEEELELKRKELDEKKTAMSLFRATHNEKLQLKEQPFSETLQRMEVTTQELTLKAAEALQKVAELELELESVQHLQTTTLAQQQDVFEQKYALQTELQRKNAEFEGLQRSAEAVKDSHAGELQVAKIQMSSELMNLDLEIQALVLNNNTHQGKLSSHENEITALKKSNFELSSKLEEEQHKKRELEEAVKELNENNETLEMELSAITDEETRARLEAPKLSKQLKEVQAEVSHVKESIRHKEAERIRLRNQLDQLDKSIKSLTKEVSQVTAELISAEKTAENLAAENRKFDAEIEMLMKVNNTKSASQSTSQVATKRSMPTTGGTAAARQLSPLKKTAQVYSRPVTTSAIHENEPRQSQNHRSTIFKPRMTSTPVHSIDFDFSLSSLLADTPPRPSEGNYNGEEERANRRRVTTEKDEVNKKNGSDGPTRFRRF